MKCEYQLPSLFSMADYESYARPSSSVGLAQSKEFEQKFASFTGASDAIACTSCTTGLHRAQAMGIYPGDEVIVPSFTCSQQCGCSPWSDTCAGMWISKRSTLTPRVSSTASPIGPKAHAGASALDFPLIWVPYWTSLNDNLRCRGCSLWAGVQWNGRHVGTIGDFGAFSFHPGKAITTGEGAWYLPGTRTLRPMRTLRDHGVSKRISAS